MVEVDLHLVSATPTVLATIAVPKIDVQPRESNPRPRELVAGMQQNHSRYANSLLDSAYGFVMDARRQSRPRGKIKGIEVPVHGASHSLVQQAEGSLDRGDVNRLVVLVENQDGCVQHLDRKCKDSQQRRASIEGANPHVNRSRDPRSGRRLRPRGRFQPLAAFSTAAAKASPSYSPTVRRWRCTQASRITAKTAGSPVRKREVIRPGRE